MTLLAENFGRGCGLWLTERPLLFLAIASHKINYDNNEIDRIAIERYKDILDL